MASQDAVTAIKVLCTLAWLFIASYYFSWGACESSVTAPIDETGWVPHGALIRSIEGPEDEQVALDAN